MSDLPWTVSPKRLRRRAWDRLSTVELDLGLVGPQSYAEDVQRGFHQLIGVAVPEGLDNQLKNEPAVLLNVERRWRGPSTELGTSGLMVDVLPYWGFGIGNVALQATIGGMLRLGQDLDVDFGPPQIRPSLAGSEAFEAGKPFAWYVFGGAAARGVAHDLFLDGNTLAKSHSVERIPAANRKNVLRTMRTILTGGIGGDDPAPGSSPGQNAAINAERDLVFLPYFGNSSARYRFSHRFESTGAAESKFPHRRA